MRSGKPAKAPEQMNKTSVVSKAIVLCFPAGPCSFTLTVAPSKSFRRPCCTPSPETSRLLYKDKDFNSGWKYVWAVWKIFHSLERILTEDIDRKNSSESELQIYYTCSTRICSRNQDIYRSRLRLTGSKLINFVQVSDTTLRTLQITARSFETNVNLVFNSKNYLEAIFDKLIRYLRQHNQPGSGPCSQLGQMGHQVD